MFVTLVASLLAVAIVTLRAAVLLALALVVVAMAFVPGFSVVVALVLVAFADVLAALAPAVIRWLLAGFRATIFVHAHLLRFLSDKGIDGAFKPSRQHITYKVLFFLGGGLDLNWRHCSLNNPTPVNNLADQEVRERNRFLVLNF